MPYDAHQAHFFIRRSLETYIILFGPYKNPAAAGCGNYEAAWKQLCAGFHHALDAIQEASAHDHRVPPTPDQLARDILDQLDKQHLKYTINRRKKVLTLHGFDDMQSERNYSATLPLEKWAAYVSGGLEVLRASDERGDARAAPETCTPEARPEALAVRVSPIDGLEYMWIPPGQFWMGALPGDMDARHEEAPRHEVRIMQGFWLSRGPVTVGAYRHFVRELHLQMPEPPSFNRGWANRDHPIVRVTWYDAAAYSEWAGGRLPTEAEWEYAARGGTEGCCYPWGSDVSPDQANYSDSKIGGTSAVGRYPPNRFGLYDVSGNVSEWSSDWFSDEYYLELSRQGVAVDPKGPSSGTTRVLRGGSWCYSSRYLRSSYRLWFEPEDHDYDIGFRCVRESMP